MAINPNVEPKNILTSNTWSPTTKKKEKRMGATTRTHHVKKSNRKKTQKMFRHTSATKQKRIRQRPKLLLNTL